MNKVIEQVRALAKAEPDFRYDAQPERPEGTIGCSYVAAGLHIDEGRGCIIGQALMANGVPKEELRRIETDLEMGASVNTLIERQPGWFEHLPVHSYETSWLTRVQEAQDTGSTWGQAVAEGEAYAKRYNLTI